MARRALQSIAVLVVLAALSVAAHAQLDQKTNPQTEIELGRRVARIVEQQFPLSPDRASQERVQRVGHAVLDQIKPRVYPYEFKALAVPEVNAFALPGGFVYVNEGLLARLPDDNALAFVLAHEATHSAHRHWAGRVRKLKHVQVLATIAVIAAGRNSTTGGDVAGLVGELAAVLVNARYSRQDENDADASAMEYLWKAGYDLDGGASTMRTLQEIERGQSVPRYLRSHPPASDRLARVTELAKTLATRPPPTTAPAGSSPTPTPDTESAAAVGDLSGIAIAPNPWFPLAVGNEWSYEVKGARGRSTYTLRVVGAVAVGEQAVYVAETEMETKTIVRCQLATTADQVWRRGRVSANDPWRLDMITRWEDDSVQVHGEYECRLLGSEPISLPCGSFAGARKIQRQGGKPTATFHTWYVEGVGLVKRQGVESGVTETLVRYRVARHAPTAVAPAAPSPHP